MSIASAKESTKTLLFVAAAVATMLAAITTRPTVVSDAPQDDDEVGKTLFPEFTDTSLVTGLEVLSFNEDLGTLQPFQIEQAREGEWIIPSRQGYPADAQDRVARAATMFVDLKISNVVQDPDFEELGVVEPKYGETQVGDQGVGTLMKVTGKVGDQPNAMLAELIIGNPVKDLVGQYYVRLPGKSRVYRVEIDPSELSTEFVDWIGRTLLPVPTTEISSLGVRSYSVALQDAQGGGSLSLAQGGYEADLEPSDDGRWKLSGLRAPLQGSLMPSRLTPGEELNQQRIAELVDAIPMLEIANVQRMPEALAKTMKTGDPQIQNTESSQALASRGFYPIKMGEEPGQLLSAQGELLINLTAGVEFRLLFGALADQSDLATTSTLSRYLIIIPRVNMSTFPEPTFEALPADDADLSENDRQIAIDRITKANARKQGEYEEKLGNIQNIVRTLQQRYGDWFYLVPEDTVRKLRLPRAELAGLSQEALEQGFGIEAFRMLQTKGLGVPKLPTP